MKEITLGNKELLLIVDSLDAFLQAGPSHRLRQEDRAVVSDLRRELGALVGNYANYKVIPAGQAE